MAKTKSKEPDAALLRDARNACRREGLTDGASWMIARILAHDRKQQAKRIGGDTPHDEITLQYTPANY